MGKTNLSLRANNTVASAKNFLIFIPLAIFQGLLFNQGDLDWTLLNSYAILQGHFFDFYSYNQESFFIAGYMPVIYAVFAIWMSPVFFMGLSTPPDQFRIMALSPAEYPTFQVNPIELGWAKTFLFIVFLVSAILVKKISERLFHGSEEKSELAFLTYLLSPFALFSVVIFGQYDILGLSISLAGYLALLSGRPFWFALLFGLAIPFKFFPIVIFVPLLLVYFKKPLEIILLSSVAISPTAVQALLFASDPQFLEVFLGLASDKVLDPDRSLLTLFVGTLVAFGLISLWRWRPEGDLRNRAGLLSVATALGLMFSAVNWHPQWLILLAPFFALALGYISHKRLFLVAEAVGFVTFIAFVVGAWRYNVDGWMITRGIAREFISPPRMEMVELLPPFFWTFSIIYLKFLVFLPIIFVVYEGLSSPKAHPSIYPRGIDYWARGLLVTSFFSIPAIALTIF